MVSDDYITMLHGAGGSVMHDFIKKYIVQSFQNISKAEVPLQALDDASVIDDIVLKSDSHVVKPIFFPGGDLGRLAVSGTVNDISLLGAQPIALSCGFILEEGLKIDDFNKILLSMQKTCVEADVGIITGDTKVVEHGSLGGLVVNTSGIGKKNQNLDKNVDIVKKFRKKFSEKWILDSNLQDGDVIIISGTLGDHGLAVLSAQEGLDFGSEIKSDVKPLNHTIQFLLRECGGIVTMKDPTRGGLADALNEVSEKSQVGILIDEDKIPIREDVNAACEMLGLDPLEIGNEGKILIGVVQEKSRELLDLLKKTEIGENAQIIGEATKQIDCVAMKTVVGGKRIITRPLGDPIPRIC